MNDTNDGKTEWALARFGGCSVSVVCRFTTMPEYLAKAADGLGTSGDTPLTYARNLALSYLISKGQAKQGRLIILCDGQDNCPEHGSTSREEAADSLQELIRNVTTAVGAGSAIGSRTP